MIPSSQEDQKELAGLIQKLVIQEITKAGFTEAAKGIKADIKELAGKEFDITTTVKAAVDSYQLEQKTREAVEKTEEAVANAEILGKLFSVNVYDEADKYTV